MPASSGRKHADLATLYLEHRIQAFCQSALENCRFTLGTNDARRERVEQFRLSIDETGNPGARRGIRVAIYVELRH